MSKSAAAIATDLQTLRHMTTALEGLQGKPFTITGPADVARVRFNPDIIISVKDAHEAKRISDEIEAALGTIVRPLLQRYRDTIRGVVPPDNQDKK